MELFFHPELINGIVELGDTEARHARVLRKKAGDKLMLVDGMGHRADCEIVESGPKHFLVHVNHIETFEKKSPKLILAVSPLKNPDRFEWLVEKCTESGVDTLVPIMCDRSEATLKKTDRLQRIIQAATTQSLQYHMPLLAPPTPFSAFLKEYTSAQKLMAYCDDVPKERILSALHKEADTIILIGPEGDFTADEFALAQQNGYRAISLGENRLRTETAAVCAAQAFYLINSTS